MGSRGYPRAALLVTFAAEAIRLGKCRMAFAVGRGKARRNTKGSDRPRAGPRMYREITFFADIQGFLYICLDTGLGPLYTNEACPGPVLDPVKK